MLTRALLHSICDFKDEQMNMQHSQIQKLMLYRFKLGHNAVKGEHKVEHRTVTKNFKKFGSGWKNLNNHA